MSMYLSIKYISFLFSLHIFCNLLNMFLIVQLQIVFKIIFEKMISATRNRAIIKKNDILQKYNKDMKEAQNIN